MLKKTKRLTLVEQVASQIEHLIESGHWEVGMKIPSEAKLMETFDVSRNTLREAIKALVHAGLLESKQGKGTIVRSSSALSVALDRRMEKMSLVDTFEVRLALEQKAAALAAERRTAADLKQLETYIENSIEAAKQRDMDAFIKTDLLFHKAIVQAADNPLLYELYEHMADAVSSSISDMMQVDSMFNYEAGIHRELLDAIRNQDSEKATTYVNEYITVLMQRLETR
ncbi:MAG TPA: FadR/GntR family transcriptional regulator [Cerasibacillus sp.]|uniref:FadR/GntR family transcriptional regulator n=1 Tax=Cerasibacillus sp. TaxID=2498711 RepID=UPI002F42BD6D